MRAVAVSEARKFLISEWSVRGETGESKPIVLVWIIEFGGV